MRSVAILVIVLWSQAAAAQTHSDQELASVSASEEVEEDDKFLLGGRVFVGDTLTRQVVAGETFWRNRQVLNSARFGLTYKHSDEFRAVIKVEAASGKTEIRDAYLRLSPNSQWRIQAGRFKRQISGIALAGKWDLPSIERGLLTDFDLPIAGGRDEGLMATYKVPVSMKPSLSVSIFQDSRQGEMLDASENITQDAYIRATIEPTRGLKLASSLALIGYLQEAADRESYRHGPMGSLELTYKSKWMRIWLEAFAGRNVTPKLAAPTSGTFVAFRGIVAPRFKTGTPRRLVPFLGASYYDPRTVENDDANTEGQLGVNLGFSKVWRVQLELTHLFAGGINSTGIEGTAFRIQLGAKFKE